MKTPQQIKNEDKSIKEIIKDVFDNEIFKDKRNLVSRDGDELWIKLRKELLSKIWGVDK